jgi:hypothetical protein
MEYSYFFWTGCGRIEARLEFVSDKLATISVQRVWMGSNDRKYLLRCRHYPASENHGLLQIESFEGNIELPAFVTACSLDEGDGIFFEYIRLQGPEPIVPDDPALPGMAGLGYGGWAKDFELFLYMTRFSAGLIQPEIPESEKLQVLMDDLEKTKFQSRVRADAEQKAAADGGHSAPFKH